MTSVSSQKGSTVDGRDVYILHNQPFSLFSIMVRFTYVLGRTGSSTVDPTDGVRIEYKLVDHHRHENLGEDYLIHVNPKGQVPALTSPKLPAPLTDSVDISYWLCGHYPNLLPTDREQTIKDLFAKLHNIDIYSLSVRAESVLPEWRTSGVPPTAVDTLLAKPDSEISPEYRKALEKKREFVVRTKTDALMQDYVDQAEKQARDFFSELLSIYNAHGGDSVWLFGPDAGPTVLDAHAVPFIARLTDEKVNRSSLVPSELKEYASRVMGRPEWDAVTHGRGTVYDASLGPVRELDPLW